MLAGFNRSISFPGSPRFRAQRYSEKSYHVRSTSLPCRSHPFISQLEDEIRSVKSWQSTQPESTSKSSAWLCDGLARLELLHASLYDFLHLPQTQDSLGSGSGSEWTGRVLDDSLRLADAHGCFRSEMVAMNDLLSDAQVALRRKDGVKLSSCARHMKKREKELIKLAASLREVSKSPASTRFTNGVEEAELAGIIREVIQVTVSASMAVFTGLPAAAAASSTTTKSSWMLSKKRSMEVEENAMERLQGLEECIGAVERRNEKVLRCLLNTRVALLSIMAPKFVE